MKKCSKSYVIRKIQIKTTFFWFVLRYKYTHVRMAKIWKSGDAKY